MQRHSQGGGIKGAKSPPELNWGEFGAGILKDIRIESVLYPCLPVIMSIFSNIDFCMPIVLQYLLIS